MCKAQSEGGQRCSSHGRQNLIATRQRYASMPDSDPTKIEAIMAAEIEYASTPEGIGWVELQQADSGDEHTRAYYERVALQGAILRERNQTMAHTNTLHDEMSYEDVLSAIHKRKKDADVRYHQMQQERRYEATLATLSSSEYTRRFGLGDLPPAVTRAYAEFVLDGCDGMYDGVDDLTWVYAKYVPVLRDAYDTGRGQLSGDAAEQDQTGVHRWSTDEIASRTEALPEGFRLRPWAYRKLSADQQKMYDHIQEGRLKPEWVTPDFTLNKAGHDEGIKRYEDDIIEEVRARAGITPPRHLVQHTVEVSLGRDRVHRLYAEQGGLGRRRSSDSFDLGAGVSLLVDVVCPAYDAGRAAATR